jgi:uncharacterized protein YndB with AHSA1/START domain
MKLKPNFEEDYNMSAQQLISRVEDRTLYLERVFNAPRELVFKAFSQAEHLKRWWGPTGWTLPVCTVDFRPGGTWHFCMECVDESQTFFGYKSWGIAVYKEIVEPERIVYTDSFSDEEGNTNTTMPQTTITMTFVEYEGKTKLISEAEYATVEDLDTVLKMGMLEGITQTWDRLAELVADLQSE